MGGIGRLLAATLVGLALTGSLARAARGARRWLPAGPAARTAAIPLHLQGSATSLVTATIVIWAIVSALAAAFR